MIEVTDTELEVLKMLWQLESATASEIVQKLNETSEWHDKTVRTLLGRMVKKGAISKQPKGRAFHYTPEVKQADYGYHKSKSLIENLFNGSLPTLVSGFAVKEKLRKDDIEELKAFISDWEREND